MVCWGVFLKEKPFTKVFFLWIGHSWKTKCNNSRSWWQYESGKWSDFFFSSCIFLYFKLTDSLNLCFELLRWKKHNLDLIVIHTAQGKSRAPEVAVRSSYCGQTRIVLLEFGSFALVFCFLLLFWWSEHLYSSFPMTFPSFGYVAPLDSYWESSIELVALKRWLMIGRTVYNVYFIWGGGACSEILHWRILGKWCVKLLTNCSH